MFRMNLWMLEIEFFNTIEQFHIPLGSCIILYRWVYFKQNFRYEAWAAAAYEIPEKHETPL